MNYNNIMLERLPKRIYNLLKSIGKIGDEAEYNTFVVGGFVRDLILDRENLDIDIVIEGNEEYFAKVFAKAKRGKVKIHEQFNTAVVTLPNGLKIDIALARTETYERPGALPTVDLGSIDDDLERRDFTINAMAIRLNENGFGDLIDPLHGESDLEKGIIRVIHDKSFQDDPTRIFRAIRYEQRYGFRLDKHTEKLLKIAVKNDFLSTITKQRLRNEILLILNEENFFEMIDRMNQFDLLKYIHPKISLSLKITNLLIKIIGLSLFQSVPLLTDNASFDTTLLKLMAIFDGLNEKDAKEASENLALTKEYTEAITASKTKLSNALKAISDESIMPSEIYKALNDLPVQTLFFGIFKASDRDTILKILTYLLVKSEKPLITGKDLKELGYPEGSQYGEILEDVFYAQLDEKVITKQEAIEYIQQKYKK